MKLGGNLELVQKKKFAVWGHHRRQVGAPECQLMHSCLEELSSERIMG